MGYAPETVAAGGVDARAALGAFACTINVACGIFSWAIIGADAEKPEHF